MNTDWIPFAGAAAGAALVYWMQSPVKKQQSFADDVHERVEAQKAARQMRLAEKPIAKTVCPHCGKEKPEITNPLGQKVLCANCGSMFYAPGGEWYLWLKLAGSALIVGLSLWLLLSLRS